MILLSNNAPPKLRVARPTPSTVSFTVSTRPVADTVPKKALLYFSHAIRLGLGVLILALFWAKWRSYFPIRNEDPESWERRLLTNYAGVCVAWAAEGIDWKVLGGVGAVGLWGVLRRGYTGTFYAGDAVTGEELVADGTGSCRGIAARAERARCPDVELFADVPIDRDDEVYSDGVHTGYFHT